MKTSRISTIFTRAKNWHVHVLLVRTLRRALSEETLKTSTCATNRKINDLLGSPLRPLAWGRTLKTSMRTTSARNWKNSDLLGRLLLDEGIGQDSRHFTNCSTICGSRRAVRTAHDGQEILGTAITCSAIGLSKDLNASITWSTICGTRASRICTKGQTSAMCSMWCRCTTTCGPRGSPRQGGREPWGGWGFCRRGASHLSLCPSSPALSFLCPLEEWCLYSDRAIATLCRSCRSHERKRRSLRRRAAPSPLSRAPNMAPAGDRRNWVDHCCVNP